MKNKAATAQVLSQKQVTVLAPQLQQGIHILQLSSLELQQEIQMAIAQNPFLESADTQADIVLSNYAERVSTKVKAPVFAGKIHPDIAPILINGSTQSASNLSTNRIENNSTGLDAYTQALTLSDVLHQQANTTPLNKKQHYILSLLVDSINDNGYLRATAEEIIDLAKSDYAVSETEVAQMIAVLQGFEPLGVGARYPRECLLIQLQDKAADTPYLDIAKKIVDAYLQQIADQQLGLIATELGISETQVQGAIRIIKALNPFPGSAFTTGFRSDNAPDLLVKKSQGQWVVRLNPNLIPAISIDESSAQLLKKARGTAGYDRLKLELSKARMLLANIQKRYQTLLMIAQIIVHKQSDFFDQGQLAFKPLSQKQVANQLGLHCSTISRAVKDKYVRCGKKVFELQYFFSSSLSRHSGSTSAMAVQAMIRQIIANEPASHPLSDIQIVSVLANQGVHIARRTVAKYRKLEHMPSAAQRKKKSRAAAAMGAISD